MDESLLIALQAELQGLNENNKVGKILNCLALLRKSAPEGSWFGFYVDDGSLLRLSYFQGTPACEEIAYGKGVVGVCYKTGEEQIVDDVQKFPGYICCDASAASEYCLKVGNAVFDVDYPLGKKTREDALILKKAGILLGSIL